MTLTELTDRLRGNGQHRAPTYGELQTENKRLHREADDLACQLVALSSEVEALTAALDRAGIDLSGAREDQRTAEHEAAWLRGELAEARARLANATAVGDLPSHVDTVPLDTRTVRERFDSGPVVRLGRSPLAGHDPTTPAGPDAA